MRLLGKIALLLTSVLMSFPSVTQAAPFARPYQYTVIAQTGQGGFSGVNGSPSVNRAGDVAFVGTKTPDAQRVWVGNGAQAPSNVFVNTNTNVQGVQINDFGLVASRLPVTAVRSRISVLNASLNDTQIPVDIALANSNFSQRPPGQFGSLVPGPSIRNANYTANNSEGAAFFAFSYCVQANPAGGACDPAAIDPCAAGCVVTGRYDPTLAPGPPTYSGFNLRAAQTSSQPMLADNNEVVFLESTARVFTSDYSLTQTFDVSGGVTGLSAVGSRPGIAEQGDAVAFAAQTASGPNVWLSVQTGSRFARDLIKVAGFINEPELGRDDANNPLYLDDFNINSRVGVIHNQIDPPGLEGDSFILAFIATPNAPGYAFSSGQGIWTVRVDVDSTGTPLPGNFYAYHVHRPISVLQIGDPITFQAGPTVSAFDSLFDPLSDVSAADGSSYKLAFAVTLSDNSRAVVRADFGANVLVVGVNYGASLRGDLDAQRVAAAFATWPEASVQTLILQASNRFNNKRILTDTITQFRDRLDPGDKFIFFFSSHGYADDPGEETQVDRQNDPQNFLSRVPSTGDDAIMLTEGGTTEINPLTDFIDDDELRSLFVDPVWAGVGKLFIIDTCFAGGLWGSTSGGDSGDLATLSDTALIAASREPDFSYASPGGDGFLAMALGGTPGGAQGAVRQMANQNPKTFSGLFELVRAQEPILRNEFETEFGEFVGFIKDFNSFSELRSKWGIEVPASFDPVAFSTSDYDPTLVPEPGFLLSLVSGVALIASLARRRDSQAARQRFPQGSCQRF